MAGARQPTSYGILGPLTIGPFSPSPGQQARLLGLLLLERGSVVPTSSLAGWALGAHRSSDAKQVHVLVSRLRRLLREQSVPGLVTSLANGYRFDAGDADIDADLFDSLARRAEGLRHDDPARARQLVDSALGLWRGELLAGLGLGDHPVASCVVERRVACLELGFIADLALGRLEALPDMLAACRQLPQRELLVVVAMTALFLAGRQTEAIALYQQARQRLGATGIRPGPGLQAAEEAVLRHDGDRLLTDILDIRGPRLRGPRSLVPTARSSPDAEVGRGRSALPRFATSFVGRGDLVEQTAARSIVPGLTTLVGPGGVGKTRLASEAIGQGSIGQGSIGRGSIGQGAASATRRVWFCELATLGDSVDAGDDGLCRLVARAVGARMEPGRSPLDAVADALLDADGVLVLDSCETQIDQAASLASHLLASCASLTILATSRLRLGVPGERVTIVSPLDIDDEATELYCHRAIDVDPGFSLAVDDLDAITNLCARLDGLPLAIELAAARSRTAGPQELLSQLGDHAALEPFRTEASGMTERHRSLAAAVDWSYRLLHPEQQQLLRRFGAFAGAVGIDDLAAVCDDRRSRGALLNRLAELVDRSMVATARRNGTTRYRLLDTIRAFASEQADAEGEVDDIRSRHAEHYAAVLDDLRQQLRGPAEAEAVARLDEVWPEVRAAVAWSVQQGRTGPAVRLVAGLGFEAVFRERGEIVNWADEVLALPGTEDHERADELLGTAGLADWGFGAFDQGLERAERAVALHRHRGTRITPDVAAALPLHLSLRGDLQKTTRLLHDHSVEAGADKVAFAQAHTRICEAMTLGFAGAGEADDVLRSAEDLANRLGCPLLNAIAAFTRAIVVLDRRAGEAAAHARRSLQLAESVGASWFLTAATNYLVAALVRSAPPESTIPYLRAGLERQQRGATVQSLANTIRNTVVVLDRLGHAERAAPLIGWLDVNRPAIPGTPGMRDHPGALSEQLRRDLGDSQFETLRLRGANATLDEVLDTALRELGEADESALS